MYGRHDTRTDWMLDLVAASSVQAIELTPAIVKATRVGRTGVAMGTVGLYMIVRACVLFLPRLVSQREQELVRTKDAVAMADSIWHPTAWRRAHLIAVALAFSVFLSMCVDLSFWQGYGNLIWYFIAAFYVVGMAADKALEDILGENMLVTPLSTSFAIMQGLVTLGANDFLGFVLSFAVDTCIYWLLTVYLNLFVDNLSDDFLERARALRRNAMARCSRFGRSRLSVELERERAEWATVRPEEIEAEVGAPICHTRSSSHVQGENGRAGKGATVEALCDVVQAYVVDTTSNLQVRTGWCWRG